MCAPVMELADVPDIANSSAVPPLYALDVGIETRLPLRTTFFLGLQHLLALTGVWVFPAVIGQMMSLSPDETAHIVQACFFTTGIVTILQSWRFLRLPVVQGPTAVFFMSVIAIGQSDGLATAYGSMMVAALIFAVIAAPIPRMAWLGRFTSVAARPLIYSMVLVIVGMQLASIGLRGWFGSDPVHPDGLAFALASASAVIVLACLVFGGHGLAKKGSLVIGIVLGSALAAGCGRWTPPDTTQIAWIAAPVIAPFGLALSPTAVAVMLLAFFHASIETTGMYSVLARWGGRQLSVDMINRGLFMEFLGCFAGAACGGLGTTSYPENVAIIRISRIGSRFVTLFAGCLALMLSFLPKFALLVASIPSPVLAAVSTILFGVIAINGIQMAAEVEWDDFNIAVAAPAFILAGGVMFLPDAVTHALPAYVQPLVSQPMVVGSVVLIVLDLCINRFARPLQASFARRL